MEEQRLGLLKEDYVLGYAGNKFVDYITNSPEQIGAFIMANHRNGDIMITDSLDKPLLSTFSIFINRCSNIDYLLKYLQPLMIDLQTGEREINYIPHNVEEIPLTN